MFQQPPVIPNSAAGFLAIQALKRAVQSPLYGTPFEHYQAQLAAPENFNDRGLPDYLAADPGVYSTGVNYTPNPKNPQRGIFCRAPFRPQQDVGGIYYVAQMSLYVFDDPGEVYKLDGTYPKRQDMFIINGQKYYATAPATPCQTGETIAAWQIDLNLERFPVKR